MMSNERTAHAAASLAAPAAEAPSDPDGQSEKFIALRALATSDPTSHENGATWLYHGQRVSFEWQLPHTRWINPETCGGTSRTDSILRPGETGGFVRGGAGSSCSTPNSKAPAPAAKAAMGWRLVLWCARTGLSMVFGIT
jgi:hypothetical protein